MISLSAVVITRNEEKRIQRCLESVRWVPEIVIVDDQSQDQTVEICRRYTDKIIIHPLNNDFAGQRNRGTRAASHQWILQLDADEVVPPQARQRIEEILQRGAAADAFRLRRMNYFIGRKMRFGGWNEKCTKLFRKGKAWYEGAVHEGLKVKGVVEDLSADIEHYPFDTFSDCLEKLNRYTSLEAGMMLERDSSLSLRECRYQMTWRPMKL
ncbi:MAG: glycosyltransferase family 2 protein, partial [Candidatus Omnitrophica bacterium]|nr:glycosyltransferase family 2 protein [Candidatus Omnitrophota bacterium]